MASEDKKPPPSLGALFAGKAKKKPKAVNLNAERPKEPEKAPAKPSAIAVAAASDEGWERALKRDQDLLEVCGLRIKEVDADGACLFRAFADQMQGDDAAHAQYREQCVDFLQAHRSDFEPFLEEDFDEYCSRMRQPKSWGGHIEVQALSRALGVNAVIYQPAEASRPDKLVSTAVEMTTSEAEDARCVQLSFHPTHHAGQHYNSVRCSTDEGSGPPPPASLAELRRRIEEALQPPEPGGGYPAAEASSAPKAKPKPKAPLPF